MRSLTNLIRYNKISFFIASLVSVDFGVLPTEMVYTEVLRHSKYLKQYEPC